MRERVNLENERKGRMGKGGKGKEKKRDADTDTDKQTNGDENSAVPEVADVME